MVLATGVVPWDWQMTPLGRDCYCMASQAAHPVRQTAPCPEGVKSS
jgi:hypothetical protein